MKRFVYALALIFLLTAPAFALSDEEYLKMRKSNSDFARADKKLSQVYSRLKSKLPKRVFAELQKSQREWVSSGRDEAAAALMNDGYSRLEAYTIATNDRADILPEIAAEISESLKNSRKSPPRKQEVQPKKIPDPEPEPEPDPEPEPTESAPLSISQIEGEYQSDNGFLTVRITDLNTSEVQVTFSRFKDGVHWTSKGWLENGVLELSDNNYSECQATLKFSAGSVKVEITDTDDWNEAVSPDFVLKGTYKKLKG